jgi:hypothetical protein
MSNDHFVAQTYLKHFGEASRGDIMYACRKSNGDELLPRREQSVLLE